MQHTMYRSIFNVALDGSLADCFLCDFHLQRAIEAKRVSTYYLTNRVSCQECECERASDESERRAEQRNEMVLHFGRIDY